MVLWAISMHKNEVFFRGRTISTDGVIHDVEGLMASWFPLAWLGEVRNGSHTNMGCSLICQVIPFAFPKKRKEMEIVKVVARGNQHKFWLGFCLTHSLTPPPLLASLPHLSPR